MSNFLTLNFQNSASQLMDLMILFHDYLMAFLILITIVVGYFLCVIIKSSFTTANLKEQQSLEIIWTLAPAVILLMILFPSMKILYLTEESSPSASFKATGHQWYWTYDYLDVETGEWDANILFQKDTFRLLDTNTRIVAPYGTSVRVLTTSMDVIHSWTVPSLSVKSDAIPGRINQMNFLMSRPGIYYGQCSEICGANHSFMPISLEAVSLNTFTRWLP